MTKAVVVLATLLPRFTVSAVHKAMPEGLVRITLRPEGGMPSSVSTRKPQQA